MIEEKYKQAMDCMQATCVGNDFAIGCSDNCTDDCYVKVVVEALEKQIPKKPLLRVFTTIPLKDGSEYALHNYYCPVCGRAIIQGAGCGNNGCRQCIDWEDDND